MSKNMLGVLAADYAGPIADLRKKLRGKDGQEWFAAFKRFLRKENPWPMIINSSYFSFFKGIDALISAGNYQKLDDWICDKNAPRYIHTGEVTVEYLDLGALSSLEEGLEKMKAMGYRPAQDPEVLAHDTKHPNQLVEGSPVAVLGSVWRSRYCRGGALILRRDGADREVDLNWWSSGWDSGYRFAAVKIS